MKGLQSKHTVSKVDLLWDQKIHCLPALSSPEILQTGTMKRLIPSGQSTVTVSHLREKLASPSHLREKLASRESHSPSRTSCYTSPGNTAGWDRAGRSTREEIRNKGLLAVGEAALGPIAHTEERTFISCCFRGVLTRGDLERQF